MSDEQAPGGPADPAGARKRPGPTIDLKATEVTDGAGSGLPWKAIGAAAAALALLGVGWLSFGRSGVDTNDARVAQLEKRVEELSARPSTSGVDPKTVEELAARVPKLEAAVANPPRQPLDPALANRMTTLDNQLKAIDEK